MEPKCVSEVTGHPNHWQYDWMPRVRGLSKTQKTVGKQSTVPETNKLLLQIDGGKMKAYFQVLHIFLWKCEVPWRGWTDACCKRLESDIILLVWNMYTPEI